MAGNISGTGRAKKIESFEKKRSAKRKGLAKEVQGRKKQLKAERKKFQVKSRGERI